MEELADLCVGTLRSGMGGDSEGKDNVVGNASATVPGAAGDTSSIIWESRGVKNLILADGPAGLRLQPLFKTTKEGELLPGGEGMGDIIAPFDESKIPADAKKAMAYSHDHLIPDMEKARELADRLEELTPAERWPFPVYSDLLFSV